MALLTVSTTRTPVLFVMLLLAGCGAGATRDSNAPRSSVAHPSASVRFDFSERTFDDAAIQELTDKAPTLTDAVLRDAKGVTPAVMGILAGCPKLKSLDLGYTEIGDADVERIAAVSSLRTLHLVGTRITDASADSLAKLRSLINLNIGDTAMGNRALEAIVELPELETLHIGATKIDEAGLVHIKDGLPKLRLLRTGGSAYSNESLEELRLARPEMSVE